MHCPPRRCSIARHRARNVIADNLSTHEPTPCDRPARASQRAAAFHANLFVLAQPSRILVLEGGTGPLLARGIVTSVADLVSKIRSIHCSEAVPLGLSQPRRGRRTRHGMRRGPPCPGRNSTVFTHRQRRDVASPRQLGVGDRRDSGARFREVDRRRMAFARRPRRSECQFPALRFQRCSR